jgi:tetratricopeptide (TPR) repeat protein
MPAVADTTLLAAIEHQRAGRLAEAEALYRSILAAEPGHGQALYLHGLLLLNSGRSHAAAAALGLAAIARPGHTAISVYLVHALLADGRAAEALPVTVRLLAAQPDHPEAAFLRGTALNALGEPALAIACFERTLAHDPGHAAASLNLGNAYADIDRWGDAERYCREAIRLAPDLGEAHASLGFILTSCGKLDEAIAACEAAIALRPDLTQAHWNQAVAALLAGDFDLGLRKYEWRKRHDRFRRDFVDLPGPQWDGGDPRGRTILVHAEQGLGDTIQFARYLPLIVARGARVVLACERPLIPLLEQLPGVSVVPKDTQLPRFDCWIDQMSLPLACGTRLDTIPSAGGYLRADPARTAAWRARLPTGTKVGLAWAGNPAHSNDRRRSMPPTALRCIVDVAGAHVVNLQVGPRASEIGLPDLSSQLTDYAETAALIEALDLVVSVDTSVVHVAGALGKPAWVMLPHAPDWRWLLGRDDSPWYSSLRLFRQPAPGDWDTVIAGVVAALARFG